MSLDIQFSPLPGKSSQSFLNDNASYHIPQLSIFQVNFLNICKVHLLQGNCFQQQQISVPMSWSRADTLLGIFASCNAGTNDRKSPSDIWKNILVLEEGNTNLISKILWNLWNFANILINTELRIKKIYHFLAYLFSKCILFVGREVSLQIHRCFRHSL